MASRPTVSPRTKSPWVWSRASTTRSESSSAAPTVCATRSTSDSKYSPPSCILRNHHLIPTETPEDPEKKTRPLRVLILSHYFWPEPIPKPRELAEALHEEGHTVEVVTGFPNYPGGALYPGYRLSLLSREEISGIAVRRTYMYPDHGKSLVGRLLNYASFMISGI